MIGTLVVDGWVGPYLVQWGGAGRAAAPPSPLLAVPNVTSHPSTASVPTSYYSMWHYLNSKGLMNLLVVPGDMKIVSTVFRFNVKSLVEHIVWILSISAVLELMLLALSLYHKVSIDNIIAKWAYIFGCHMRNRWYDEVGSNFTESSFVSSRVSWYSKF